ncbi:MAG TPA: hypothetical protein VES42_00300 [Pilimelia sp.]|nr:hypothetical protein [Pilimelia sp.]
MTPLTRRNVAIAATAGAALSVLLLPAPAMADTAACALTAATAECKTADLPANARHQALHVTTVARGPAAVDCAVVETVTGKEVGRLRSTGQPVTQVIRGVAGSYHLRCRQDGPVWGAGGGELRNDTLLVR